MAKWKLVDIRSEEPQSAIKTTAAFQISINKRAVHAVIAHAFPDHPTSDLYIVGLTDSAIHRLTIKQQNPETVTQWAYNKGYGYLSLHAPYCPKLSWEPVTYWRAWLRHSGNETVEDIIRDFLISFSRS